MDYNRREVNDIYIYIYIYITGFIIGIIQEIKKVSYNKNYFMNIIIQMGMRVLQACASP